MKCCGKPEVTLHIYLQCDGLAYLNVVLWNQPNVSSWVLCFNPATSDILKEQTTVENLIEYYSWDQAAGRTQKNKQMKLFMIMLWLSHLQH